jgi:hypothetical protein
MEVPKVCNLSFDLDQDKNCYECGPRLSRAINIVIKISQYVETYFFPESRPGLKYYVRAILNSVKTSSESLKTRVGGLDS